MRYLKLWSALAAVMVASFAVLGYYGFEIYRQAPPIPERVVSTDGQVLFSGQDIRDGQNVWQSIGGQELGSIWGHGAYVAPDWSADWLHREASWLLDHWAMEEHGSTWAQLDPPSQAMLKDRLQQQMRTNTYDPQADEIVISPDRARAFEVMSGYYAALFGDAESFPEESRPLADGGMTPPELRDAYAVATNTIRDDERQRMMNAFFFWTAWACATERPTEDALTAVPGVTASAAVTAAPQSITYTNNWPPETLIENRPTGSIFVWAVLSFVLLVAGFGGLGCYYGVLKHKG